jgi:hypothetical protein
MLMKNLRPFLIVFLIAHLVGLPAPAPADTCCGSDEDGRCAADCANPCAACACCTDRSPNIPAPVVFSPLSLPMAAVRSPAAPMPPSPAPREILHVPEVVPTALRSSVR